MKLLDPNENILYASTDLAWDADNGEFDPADLQYIYLTDQYREYALRMAEWAKRGVWPTTVMSNTTTTNDLIVEGKSASVCCRTTEAETILNNGSANGLDLEFITLMTENNVGRQNAYNGDAIAIAAFSRNPERAATLLDVLKNDYETNCLIQGGVEGRHYILNEDGTRSAGPEVADYGWSSWAWGLRSSFQPKLHHNHEILTQTEAFYETIVAPYDMFPFAGFSVNNDKYSAEVAVILSLEGEYEYSLDLDAYGNHTEEALDKFISELKDAGIDEVVEYWRQQCKDHYDEYLASK